MTQLLKFKPFYYIIYIFVIVTTFSSNKIIAEQKLKIESNELYISDKDKLIEAYGNAVAIHSDGSIIESDFISYNERDGAISADGNVIFIDEETNSFFLDKLTTDDNLNNLTGNEVRARLNDSSRIVGTRIKKRGNVSVLSDAEFTPCVEDNYLIKNCPGWKMKANKIFQDSETKTLHYDHATIHLFNVPVLYLPYFSHPDPSVNKKSGLLMPTVETDSKLGDTFSIPIFYNIQSNQDITLTPTIQSKSNNFYSLNYRMLNSFGSLDLNASTDDNDDNKGTRNHIFLDTSIINPYGDLDVFLKTSNNDTYMRKNKINNLTVLNSGIDFERETKNTFFSFNSGSYKHLTIENAEQWEYVYPKITYNINNIKNDIDGSYLSLNNELLYTRDLDRNYTSLISSQLNWMKSVVRGNTGLLLDNEFNFRALSVSVDNKDSEDTENIRFYPQISSKISYPLMKISKNSSHTITPILMPIIAPYNNYTESQVVTNSNIFSSNRASSITEWESGPRLNYGLEWYSDFLSGPTLKIILGQNYRINKKKTYTNEELSDYYLTSNIMINQNNYFNNTFEIARKNIDIKKINLNAYSEISNLKFAIDYDYTSEKFGTAKEQIALGGEYNFAKDFFIKFTGSKDIDTNKNIGYQYGLLYENDCLGIDFNYYRDLTIDRDIEESDGYSFTIVLKPFGSTRSYGKSKVFGPVIN